MFLSPLGREYCSLYYILMIFALIQLFVAGGASLRHIINSKKDRLNALLMSVLGMSAVVVEYFLARLIYSICVRAL